MLPLGHRSSAIEIPALAKFLVVRFEGGDEISTGSSYTGSDGADGTVTDLGRLRVLQAEDLGQHEGGATVDVQVLEQAVEFDATRQRGSGLGARSSRTKPFDESAPADLAPHLVGTCASAIDRSQARADESARNRVSAGMARR